MEGEVVSYRAKLTWCVFVLPIALISVFIGIPWLIIVLLNYMYSEFGITNKRLVLKTGVIKRQIYETTISKIERIDVTQGVFGRMLNYGTITVSGTGGALTPFAYISDPITFKKKIQEQIASLEETKR